MKRIQNILKYDPYFGAHSQGSDVFTQLRRKALKLHVQAYKVIGLDELAQDFSEPQDRIRKDLASLIMQRG